MQESRRYRITKEELSLLESLNQYERRDMLCKPLGDAIKDEEDAVPTYEDLRASLYTYLPETSINEIINPIILDERRHKEVLSKLSSRMGCKKR
jgi:rubrerythrin